jgi:hypothetical protein
MADQPQRVPVVTSLQRNVRSNLEHRCRPCLDDRGLAASPAADTAPTRKPPHFNSKRDPPGILCRPGSCSTARASSEAFPVGEPDPGDLNYRYELQATKALCGWAADLTVWRTE